MNVIIPKGGAGLLRQPTGLVRVNRKNRFGKHLLHAFFGDHSRDIVTGAPTTLRGTSPGNREFTPTKQGMGVSGFSGGNNAFYSFPISQQMENARLISVYTEVTSIVAAAARERWTAQTTTNGQTPLSVMRSGSAGEVFRVSYDGNKELSAGWTEADFSRAAGGLSLDQTGPGAAGFMWAKGKSTPGSAATLSWNETGAITPIFQVGDDFYIGQENSAAEGNLSDAFNLTFIFDYHLEAEDYRLLWEDPYQVFEPVLDFPVFVAAGGGTTVNIDTGSLNLTGNPLTTSLTRDLATGSFSLLGQALTTRQTSALGTGSYAQSGQVLTSAQTSALAQGSFVVSGQTITSNQTVTTDTGSFLLSGGDLNLVTEGATVLDTGSFSVNGNPLTTSLTRDLGTGSYSLTGGAVTIASLVNVSLETGSFVLSGGTVDTIVSELVSLETGSLVLTGNDLTSSQVAALESGGFDLTGGSLVLTGDGIGLKFAILPEQSRNRFKLSRKRNST